jgi:hypothetical protein
VAETKPGVSHVVDEPVGYYGDKFCRLCGAPCEPRVVRSRFNTETGARIDYVRFFCTAKRWWLIAHHSGDLVHFPG